MGCSEKHGFFAENFDYIQFLKNGKFAVDLVQDDIFSQFGFSQPKLRFQLWKNWKKNAEEQVCKKAFKLFRNKLNKNWRAKSTPVVAGRNVAFFERYRSQ